MQTLNELVNFLDNYLDIKNVKDASFNGLQVQGRKNIKKIMFAVTAGMETFKKAVDIQADMIVVHHGLFWKGVNPNLTSYNFDRVDFLIKNNISLYASHLPLDKHPEVGNNVQLLKLLGFNIDKPFAFYDGQNISFTGKADEPKTIQKIREILEEELGATCKVLPFGKKEIKTMAVCSGGGGYPQLTEAINADVDFYLTGDSTEFYHVVKDAKFNVICAGHHATETVGVKALADLIKDKFDIATEFMDIPTGL
ncbi:Nif3-like dinuclear metal center hexameric protein [Candidatus Dependentiae bacterium]|nr:Nif3-like dinuclear metal center hexameric protein [Candidatus Dependentiae bacterium]